MLDASQNLRTRIKVCGITRTEDAFRAIEAGADALGFVFYKKSPRFIDPSEAAEMIKLLPPFVSTVGLFVNATQDFINDAVARCNINVIQLHGDESPDFCAEQKPQVIKALPISGSDDLQRVATYDCPVLLDAKAPAGVYGGTGHAFDWKTLDNFSHKWPLILAGGLNAVNIKEALTLRPWYAVDVSSGVELSKGIKSNQKLNEFCKKVHQFNGRV